MRIHTSIFTAVFSSFLLAGSVCAEDFKPPQDGKITEKQLTNYIEVTRDQMNTIRSAGKQTEGNNAAAANMAIVARASKDLDDSITAHGFTKPEYSWVAEVVAKCWPVAVMQQQWEDNGKRDVEKQIKARTDDANANRAKLATYEQAQKDGTRILTKDQRDAAVTAATGDRDAVAAEVKSDEDALKPIEQEITQHDKEAADAETAAKNPPPDVTVDNRPGYIDEKKNEAQTAHDAAKDSRDHLAELKKTLDDAKGRLAIANNKLDHPELPATDDEKARVKTENEQAIADVKTAITDDDQAVVTLKENASAGPMAMLGNDEKDKPDPDNLALVKKHIKEYLEAIGASDMLKAN